MLCLISSLIFIEITLQKICSFSPYAHWLLCGPSTIPDKKLMYRPSPTTLDHDEKGFRNKSVPSNVYLVAIGDSITYGHNLTSQEAWPQQLALIKGIVTYNMSFHGYGPVHGLYLMDDAIKLKPKYIIYAFYTGNDLLDSFLLVDSYYKNKQISQKPFNTSIQEVVNEIEEKQIPPEESPSEFRFLTFNLLRSLFHNAEYKLAAFPSQNILPTIFWSGLKASTLFIKDNYAYDDGHVKSIFTINYRLRNMNLNDRRVSQGLKFSLEAFSLMSKKARAANVIFMVMIIPTKELAFKEIVYNSKNKMPQEFDKLIENEELIIDKIKEHCKKEAIIVIDSTSRLRDYLRRGIQPYKVSIDGHPNVFGQRVLAEVVKDKITDMEAALYDKQQR